MERYLDTLIGRKVDRCEDPRKDILLDRVIGRHICRYVGAHGGR